MIKKLAVRYLNDYKKNWTFFRKHGANIVNAALSLANSNFQRRQKVTADIK